MEESHEKRVKHWEDFEKDLGGNDRTEPYYNEWGENTHRYVPDRSTNGVGPSPHHDRGLNLTDRLENEPDGTTHVRTQLRFDDNDFSIPDHMDEEAFLKISAESGTEQE